MCVYNLFAYVYTLGTLVCSLQPEGLLVFLLLFELRFAGCSVSDIFVCVSAHFVELVNFNAL